MERHRPGAESFRTQYSWRAELVLTWLLLLTKENASLAFRGASGSFAVNSEHRASHSDLHFSSCLANVIKIHSLASSCAYTDTYVQNPAANISSHSSCLRKTNGDAGSGTHTYEEVQEECVKIRGMLLHCCFLCREESWNDKQKKILIGDFSSFFFMVTSVSPSKEGIWIQFTHAQHPILHACTQTHTPSLQMAGGILHAWLGLLAAAVVARRQQRGADIRKSKLTTGGLI